MKNGNELNKSEWSEAATLNWGSKPLIPSEVASSFLDVLMWVYSYAYA